MSEDQNKSKELNNNAQPNTTINPEGNNEHTNGVPSSTNPDEVTTNDNDSNNNTDVLMDESTNSKETQTELKNNESVSIIPIDTTSSVLNNTSITGGTNEGTQSTPGGSSVDLNKTADADEKDKNTETTHLHPISGPGNTYQPATVVSEKSSIERHQEATSVVPINNAPIDLDIGGDIAPSVNNTQPIQSSGEKDAEPMEVGNVIEVNNEPVIQVFTSLYNLNNVTDSSNNQPVNEKYLPDGNPNNETDPLTNPSVIAGPAPVDNYAPTNIVFPLDNSVNNERVRDEESLIDGKVFLPVGVDIPPPGGVDISPPGEVGIPPPGEVDILQFRADKSWLDPQFHPTGLIKKPHELQDEMTEPSDPIDENLLNRIQGSMIGMALGDALGAHVEFRPHQYMLEHPVTDLEGGGTWGLQKGQFTDDTSMALCLANSLVARRSFVPYDQLVRYKWWYKLGYMSSTGECFDIGAATSQSIREFERRQKQFAKQHDIPLKQMDCLLDPQLPQPFNTYCSEAGVAGNGALMRLAPVPLFFFRYPASAVELSGYSGLITHGDKKAYDACRYYGALIVGALHGYKKEQLLDKDFYSKHRQWFGEHELHDDIKSIAEGSYQKNGHEAGIRGKGYIVNALEAALWAFWSDENCFEIGALAAVNLGDDTDTTAAIYGQLAGAYYGYKQLPERWLKHVYARTFMEKLSKWIAYEGQCCQKRFEASAPQS